MFRQELMDKTIQHALKNPIQSRGRNTISRMAAVITNDGYPDWRGMNCYKSHPMMFRFSKNHSKISLHAEISALLGVVSFYHNEYKIREILSDCDIYVARVLKDGSTALAKPCETCLGALTYFNIRNIY